MKRIRKRDIIKGIIAIIAVANLALLFGFEYEIFGFEWANFYKQKFSHESEFSAEAATGAIAQTATASTSESAAVADTRKEDAAAAGTSAAVTTADGATTAENRIEETNNRKCRVISSKNARIRSGPGTEHNRVTSVPSGTILEVLDVEDNGWVHVRTDDGTEGYVSGDLVEMIDEE